MSVLDTTELRSAFGRFMTGVTVVTTRSTQDECIGFTANSFTSVSMDPPLLLVCPGNHLNSFSVFEHCEHFAVNVLAEGQEAVSNVFASAGENKFSEVEWEEDAQGCPWITGSSACFSCRVHQRYPAGDHLILVGEVLQFHHANSRGLGYCSDGYFSLSKERQANAASPPDRQGVVGAIIEYNNHLLISRSTDGDRLPTFAQASGQGAGSTLKKLYDSLGLDITLGPVYSIYDETVQGIRYTFLRAQAVNADTAGLGQYLPIDSILPGAFADPAQASMLTRFLAERASRAFGLYVGDVESGEIYHHAEQD